MSLLTPGQTKFAQTFAADTGLDPHVVGSWLLAEQSGSAAQGYEKQGYNNWLNIARTDSNLNAPGSHGNYFADPVTAAHTSAQWIKGQGPIASSYGKPASGITKILSAGKDPGAQIAAIANSGWASSGYSGGSTLRQLFSQLSGTNLQAVSSPQLYNAAVSSVQGFPNLPTVSATPNVFQTLKGLEQGREQLNPDLVGPSALESGWAQLEGLYNKIHAPVATVGTGTPATGDYPVVTTQALSGIPTNNGNHVPNSKGNVGFTPSPGTTYNKGSLPQLATRLDALGKALGLKLTGVSGYRTPQHSVAVGGFPNDPHTKAQASDTPGIENVPEATLNNFGLTRPFSGSKELDHIQLLGSIK